MVTAEPSTLTPFANVIGMVCAYPESAESFSLTLAMPTRNFAGESFGLCVKFGMTFAGPFLLNPYLLVVYRELSILPPELLVKGE